jgi:hypothetical protein
MTFIAPLIKTKRCRPTSPSIISTAGSVGMGCIMCDLSDYTRSSTYFLIVPSPQLPCSPIAAINFRCEQMWTHILLPYPSASPQSHHQINDHTELGPLRECTRHRKRRGRRKALASPLRFTLVTALLFVWISTTAMCSGSVLRNNCRKVGESSYTNHATLPRISKYTPIRLFQAIVQWWTRRAVTW